MFTKLSSPRIFRILLILLLTAFPALAQERTVGVMVHTEDAYDGYALFTPIFDSNVYLMDNDGRIIHTWNIEETRGVLEAHLLENGHLIIVAGARDETDESLIPASGVPSFGSIREYTWDNELVWEVQFVGAESHHHHGIDIMPNGNILAILWDYHSLDEALAMGLDPGLVDHVEFQDHPYLLPDRIIEIDRSTGELVWQWDPWDHLVQDLDPDLPNYGIVSEHPRRIDINYHDWFLRGEVPSLNNQGVGDWMHSNAVNYSPKLDQAVLSVRHFDEFWIIDHRASAEEAAGPAGDLLYRWGNPFAYRQGDPVADRQLFRHHDVHWIEAGLPGEGNILLFNNRNQIYTDEEYSSVIELKLPLQPDGSYDWDQEAEIVWSYAADGFHSQNASGVQRLPNGNTFITEGFHGRLIEVTSDGETVWEFVNPQTRNGLVRQGDPPNPEGIAPLDRNALFRVHKYPLDYPGFAGKDMTPGDRLVD